MKTVSVLTIALFTVCILAFLSCPAAEAFDYADITADHIEHNTKENTYYARGSVTVRFEDAILTADEIFIDANTHDAVASGNVRLEDPESTISADRIEVNLKTKTGVMYDSYSFYRENNFHIRSKEVKKVGENSYTLDKAHITTCDSDPPEWHIAGKDIKVEKNESIRGWHGTFNILKMPVLYTPYFWAPLNQDRQTGFLFPSFGYSTERGSYYKQGFFWAIADNQDATFYGDYYDEKGYGQGLDYRYVLSPDTRGEIWLYHVRDSEPDRNLGEIKAVHDQEFKHDISTFVKIHNVTHYDYYETMESTSANRFGFDSWDQMTFGIASAERDQKFIESNIEVAKQFLRGRTYVLAQGRQSLEGSSREIPQSLPELALELNTNSYKFLSFNLSLNSVNFWKEEGQDAVRFDLYPNLTLSYGRLFNITQKVGVRETVYMLREPNEYEDRFIYDLNTALTTEMYKRYSSFVHLIEPSVEYTYIPHVDQDEIPFFDSTDSIPKVNEFSYALTNRISGIADNRIEARFRLSQSYTLLDSDRPFSPLLAESVLSSKHVNLTFNASYDVHESELTEFIGSASLSGKIGYVSVGNNLRKSTDLDQYVFSAGLNSPIKLFGRAVPLSLSSTVWYDTKNSRIQEQISSATYRKQCWGVTVSYNERPDEYQLLVSVQFTGLGALSLGSMQEGWVSPSVTILDQSVSGTEGDWF